MKRTVVTLAAVGAALVAAPTAWAGCMATVQLSSTPQNLTAGSTWPVDVTVLQHGRTPMNDATPAVIVRDLDSGKQYRYAAARTDRAGTYHANVSFPSSGRWSYAVYDGFPYAECAQTHSFAAITVGGSGGGGIASTLTGPWGLGSAAAALLAAAGVVMFARRRQPPGATVPAA